MATGQAYRDYMRDYMRKRREKDPEENRRVFRNWRIRNLQADLDRCAARREREALAALAALPKGASKPSPKISALLELAKVKAQQVNYGYTGVINADHR